MSSVLESGHGKKIIAQVFPMRTVVAERREEARLEAPDRVRRRQQVIPELGLLDQRALDAGKFHRRRCTTSGGSRART
jgi:hypothetical protein